MIKTPTVFILGAGASKPYGYPTGLELTEKILDNNIALEDNIVKALNTDLTCHSRIQKNQQKFKEAFRKSSLNSIDAFLEKNKDFMLIGKANIAAQLINYESDSSLRRINDRDQLENLNWYRYLFNERLIPNSNFENFGENKVSFITFNYDRSLEQFLMGALQSTFKEEIPLGKEATKACKEKLDKIKIIHLYGQLDLLPWQDYKEGYPYSHEEKLLDRIRNSKNNIHLMNDEREEKTRKAFADADELIKQAKKIYFLGFSYDRVNLERFDLSFMEGKHVLGTAKNLYQQDKAHIFRIFSNRKVSNPVLVDSDILPFLGDYLSRED